MPGTYPIPWTTADRPLGRHVNHDPHSRRFPYTRGAALVVPDVRHERHIPIFDQGYLGSCTAQASLGILAHGPYWRALCAATGSSEPTGAGPWPFTAGGTLALYSEITANDPFEGQYPPDDTGSDGLSAAKALQRAEVIPGYQHTFALADAVAALADFPLLVGTNWSNSMFYPDATGLVKYQRTSVIGGHEWIVDEADSRTQRIGGTTSWGSSFGVGGRFYLSLYDFGRLLQDNGDVIVLTPPTAPAPQPEPNVDPADRALLDAVDAWRRSKGL